VLKSMTTTRFRNIATIVILATMTAGCAQMKDWLNGLRTADTNESVFLDAPEAGDYIQEMYELASGDPATQAEIYADAESAAKLTPGPSTELRYGLVLATPGHSGSNPQKAQGIFRELLAQTELMTSSETALATIHLKSVEQQIVLGAETRRLRQASAERSRTAETENKRLRRSLEEAEQKLEAITSIERSIREQSDIGEMRN